MNEDGSAMSFSPEQERALSSVLDEIIPRSEDGRLPGAGELGLVDYVARQARAIQPLIIQGVEALDELARSRGAPDFAALSRQERRVVLDEHTIQDPGFLPSLIFHTYMGYYHHDRVVSALGLEPRPPHPKGYELELGDLSLLDRVRQRPRLYRDPDG